MGFAESSIGPSLQMDKGAQLAMVLSANRRECPGIEMSIATADFPKPEYKTISPAAGMELGRISMNSTPKPTLLAMPYEIRSHIWSYVLVAHPVHHAHLAPLDPPTTFSGMNTAEFHTVRVRSQSDGSECVSARNPQDKLASRDRSSIQGKIPTGLLASCRQVYEETRMLPWERNTFKFIDWFWSGVYAARQFTGRLQPWQSERMRWVGVEVLGRDLWAKPCATNGATISSNAPKTIGEWRELCGLWSGVWGLKLCIKGTVGAHSKSEIDASRSVNFEPSVDVLGLDRGLLDINLEWISDGLLHLGSLRWIELEIEDEDIHQDMKIGFCAEFEKHFQMFNQGQDGDMRVVLVKKVKVKKQEIPNKGFVWYGGEPGDDSIWGTDSG